MYYTISIIRKYHLPIYASIYHNGGVPSSAVHTDTNAQEWVPLAAPTEGDKAMWRS